MNYLVGDVGDDLGPAVGEGHPVGSGGVVAIPLLLYHHKTTLEVCICICMYLEYSYRIKVNDINEGKNELKKGKI